MLLLRQLFDAAGGGSETDSFKHLVAAFTVLRSLGSAKTAKNCESSRIVSSFANLCTLVKMLFANNATSLLRSVIEFSEEEMTLIGTFCILKPDLVGHN